MPHNDVEVEIKARLSQERFEEIRDKIKKMAKFENSSHQVDEYFVPAHRNFLSRDFPFEWLSVRRRSGKTMFSYKHYYPENSPSTTHCDEFETEVANPENLEKILNSLNFTKLVTVEKEREVFSFQDEFEIALDDVKDLGFYVEIEALKDFGGVEPTRKRILEFAKSLNIGDSDLDNRGYPYMLLKKKGLIK